MVRKTGARTEAATRTNAEFLRTATGAITSNRRTGGSKAAANRGRLFAKVYGVANMDN